MTARTLYDKIWDEHVVHTEEDGTAILYIDRHLVHEVTSPVAQAPNSFIWLPLAVMALSGMIHSVTK